MISLALGLCLVGITLECYGGRAKVKKGPPSWAPAHGYRAKYHYRYYPSSHIYFDVGRGLYFYFNGVKWLKSPSIPAGIPIEPNDYVTLDMDVDKPYKYHSEIIKRYPRGQKKKKYHKRKGKRKR